MGEQPSREQEAVEAFVVERRPRVLARAIGDLRRSSLAELPAVTHRLSGTLGTYRLEQAQRIVDDLHRSAVEPLAEEDLADRRAAALARLEGLARADPATAVVP